MQTFANAFNVGIVRAMVEVINGHASWLDDIDGVAGDGDYGTNIDKAFQMAAGQLAAGTGFAEGLKLLGRTLTMEVGSSMGPIYGIFFSRMAKVLAKVEDIGLADFNDAMQAGLEGVLEVSEAQPGDKTMLDALQPACRSLEDSAGSGKDFKRALMEMSTAAHNGLESTKGMVARLGNAARQGGDSRGEYDAGAASCALLLSSMAMSVGALLSGA